MSELRAQQFRLPMCDTETLGLQFRFSVCATETRRNKIMLIHGEHYRKCGALIHGEHYHKCEALIHSEPYCEWEL